MIGLVNLGILIGGLVALAVFTDDPVFRLVFVSAIVFTVGFAVFAVMYGRRRR